MDLDLILERTGGFGRFQFLLVTVFLPLAFSLGSFSYWAQILILLIPDHFCQLPPDWAHTNTTTTTTGQCDITETNIVPDFSSFRRFPVQGPWLPVNAFASVAAAYAASGNATTVPSCEYGWKYDYSVMYPTITSENNWVCHDSWKSYLPHTIYWIGSTVGYFFNGFLLDRFGRWKVLFVLVVVQIVSTTAAIFTASIFPLFCILRFLAGLSTRPMQTSAYTLALELISSDKRNLVGVTTHIYWLLAAAVLPWVALLSGAWQWILVCTVVPGPILLILMKFIPESPSWLQSQGETEKAFEVFSYINKVNRGEQESSLTKIKEHMIAADEPVKNQNILKTTAALLRTPTMRKMTILLFITWFSICLAYHGNNLGQSATAGNKIFLLYSLGSLFEIPISFIQLATVDKVGRKPPIVISLLLASIAAPVVHFIQADSQWVRFGMDIAVRGLFSLGYNIMFMFGCEMFPTPLRGRGIFFMRTLGDTGTSIAPLILSWNESWPFSSSVVFSGLSVLCILLTFCLPETMGCPLPQTIHEAEEFFEEKPLLPFVIPCLKNGRKCSDDSLENRSCYTIDSPLSLRSHKIHPPSEEKVTSEEKEEKVTSEEKVTGPQRC